MEVVSTYGIDAWFPSQSMAKKKLKKEVGITTSF